MPIEALVDHPEAMTLPTAGFGILLRLVLHFWATECRPLPVADHELRSIARAHAPTWRRWKPVVLRVFEACRPELDAYYDLRETKRTTLSRLGYKTAGRRRLKALEAIAPDPAPVARSIPLRSERPIDLRSTAGGRQRRSD
ncbi:MAG: hypothetical protein KGM93_18445 [Sphingomonadales bacterium]|nr:hypothetical protein [Sphingomonadales bacterium]